MKKKEILKQPKTKKIILASSSPRRKELLNTLNLRFRVVVSGVDEKFNPRFKPRRQAEELSLQKALVVVKKISDGIVIAADTLVVLEDQVFGKPIDFREAKRFLKKLSGKTHMVITGVTIIDTTSRKRETFSEVTYVTMKKLSQEDIDHYVVREETTDKAGGYAIQGIGSVLIEKIDGDYTNVVGLPLFSLTQSLRKFRVNVL